MNKVIKKLAIHYAFISVAICCTCAHLHCGNVNENAVSDKPKPNDDRYQIDILDDPDGYTPGENYTVYLRINPKKQHDFVKFLLTIEAENDNYGKLIIHDPALTKFSHNCKNTIVEKSSIKKSHVSVIWEAPLEEPNCVTFKATVIVSKEFWYSEEGALTKVICQSDRNSWEIQPPIVEECNACDEARYEVVFQGLWTRNVFPNDFPDNEWTTRFSDVVGASHVKGFKIFEYEEEASVGIKELAENGTTKPLENELKQAQGSQIRTIIKAKGLIFPNTDGNTYAVFRVDRERHLMSLVSSLTPSPDWFVGVSNYELCTPDGTWIESAVFNLYPIDAGTDSGKNYTSKDEPLEEPLPIMRISPYNQERSTSFNIGEKLPPIARINLTRHQIYEKNCADYTPRLTILGSSENCEMGEKWSQCSVTCGTGIQTLETSNGDVLKQRTCQGVMADCSDSLPTENCELADWGPWSSWTNNTCGSRTKVRERKYKDQNFALACEFNNSTVSLQENEEKPLPVSCRGKQEQENCSWKEWSSCKGPCNDRRFRKRQKMSNFGYCGEEEVVECYDECDQDTTCTPRSTTDRRRYIQSENLISASYLPVKDCLITMWSRWSHCKPIDGSCGEGYQTRNREILQHPLNGGEPCPRRLYKYKKCWRSC